jgi:hypothetical protein
LFDLVSFVRAAAFAVFYAGLEYRYVNRREKEWTTKVEGLFEKPAFWKIYPYHAYLLFPIFVIAGYAMPLTAWAGNTLLIIALEDIAYFVWRGSWVRAGEWTTTLFGSIGVGGRVIPTWWIPSVLVVLVLYWVPL